MPLLALAEQTRLPQLIAEKVLITTSQIKSGAANPAPKLLGVIAGMCAGADSIDDLDMLRVGGMPILFDGVYAPSTLGVLLREFSFGHARQLESVLREHLVALAERTEVLVGLDEQAYLDIDSLLRPVLGLLEVLADAYFPCGAGGGRVGAGECSGPRWARRTGPRDRQGG